MEEDISQHASLVWIAKHGPLCQQLLVSCRSKAQDALALLEVGPCSQSPQNHAKKQQYQNKVI